MIRTDLGLHAEVRATLRSVLGPAGIRVGVAVHDGIVTLTGLVPTPQDKLAAERAVQHVAGVHAVAEELQVQGEEPVEMTDEELANAIVKALANGMPPVGRGLTIKVEHGWVVVGGTVASSGEYADVERTLDGVAGVRGVTSEVRIEAQATPAIAHSQG